MRTVEITASAARHANTLRRFWVKVDRHGECWTWTASRHSQGYGLFRLNDSVVFAHRLSWVIAHGEIQNGMDVLHRCDNPPCVRPSHLFLGTHQDNMRDRDRKGRCRVPRGEHQWNSKLTEMDVRDIRAMRARGDFLADIGAKFSVSLQTVHGIVTGKAWKHIS